MMLRSLAINSPVDDHEDRHLRRLLDERVAHAPFHARYPSVSEFTDTPSVYSHPFFSPRPMAFSDHDANFSSNRSYTTQNNWSSTPTQLRHNHDGISDLATSMLDLDDDSSVSVEYQDDEDNVYGQRGTDSEEDESMPRMSLLGPKMRFHSKAPWEDEPVEVVNEADRSAHPVSALKKTFKLGTSSSSAGRASDESSHSQSKSKTSLDILTPQMPNARAALNALSQPNPSTSTLVSSTRSTSSKKRNLSGPQSPITYGTPSPPASPHETTNSHFSNNHARHDSRSETHSLMRMHSNTSEQPSSLYQREESYHPYANPDFAVNYTRSPPPIHDPPLLSTFEAPDVSRSDSTNTLTESSAAGSYSGRPTLRPTVSPETSDTSSMHHDVRSRKRSSTLHGREISSPIPTRLPPDTPPVPSSPIVTKASHVPPQPAFANIPGWLDRPASPSFGLISLEEARAQRSRSATVTHGSGTPSRLAYSLTETDADQDTASVLHSIDHSSIDTAALRSRARSVSAGTKAKQALQSMVSSNPPKFERRDSEPTIQGGVQPNKALKHKKSGFMKFFNKDKEAPPMPLLSESISSYQISQPTTKPSKLSTHRIPVPPLSTTYPQTDYGPSAQLDPKDLLDTRVVPLLQSHGSNPRRTPPLSINTHSPSRSGPPLARGDSHLKSAPLSLSPTSWPGDTVPQSAPAHVTEFPALKLRPVSTVFSSHFRDHLAFVPGSPRLEMDNDALSPDSAGTVLSPITPSPSGPPPLLAAAKPDSASVRNVHIQNDPDAVIKALQDQIVSAKQAWQRQIWELEGQVRDLKAEVDELRSAGKENGHCDTCGRGASKPSNASGGVINRPRARTGTSARFGSDMP